MVEPRSPGPVEAGILESLAPAFAVRFGEFGGARLRYLEGGQGPTLVLLHGRGQSAPCWLPYLTGLGPHRRVLAIDLPGFGHSRPAAVPLTGPESGLDFFLGPVEALLASLAPGPVAIAGHSLGGLLGVELALRGRIPVERLALIAPMGLGPSMTLLGKLFFLAGPERLARWLGPERFRRLVPSLPPTPLGERLNALDFEQLSVPGGRRGAAAAFNRLFSLFGPALHRGARLGEVRCPTLVIAGERDALFPRRQLEAAVARIPGARLDTLPLGHSPHLERPEQVLPILMRFLAVD